jgi:hypothetical protein
MTRRKALERWETEIGNCKVTTLWPVVKPLMKRDGPKAPTAVHGPLGITNMKASVITDCLINQFKSHDLCDENQERQMET